MQTAAPERNRAASMGPDADNPVDLTQDPRWELVERIAQTEAFRKSSKLPPLIRYLARCSITGDRSGLTEQMIGRAVFGKSKDYTPAEDGCVRVYVRQLRLRLHEYYQSANPTEPLLISVPKGGYTLTFSSAAQSINQDHAGVEKATFPNKLGLLHYVSLLLLAIAVFCASGWYWAANSLRPKTPWPVSSVIGAKLQTTLVLADSGYSLRMLGDREVSLDRYADHNFLEPIMPKHMTDGEARLIQYLDVSRTTSVADAQAAAAMSALAAPFAQNLIILSAKDFKPNDLTHGNFIFVGAKTSNPWAELFDDRLNFKFIESAPGGARYILNRRPQAGEQSTYSVPDHTGVSGEDYATITLLPVKNGSGNILLIQGLRMEGTEAAIDLLRNEDQLAKLGQKLTAVNANRRPTSFEALVHARSVAGAPVSVDLVAVRIGT
ncbi:MAG TPA: hypothetical protein VGU46_01250 [Acidobacteriaceae bacterium]|nr:hypothetical protein [Acidobacteriaceae bacterium]